jgi:hypothetical protein
LDTVDQVKMALFMLFSTIYLIIPGSWLVGERGGEKTTGDRQNHEEQLLATERYAIGDLFSER